MPPRTSVLNLIEKNNLFAVNLSCWNELNKYLQESELTRIHTEIANVYLHFFMVNPDIDLLQKGFEYIQNESKHNKNLIESPVIYQIQSEYYYFRNQKELAFEQAKLLYKK